MKESDKESIECPICLEPVSRNQISRIKGCWHEFHFECICKWAELSKSTCPLCKFKFDTIHYAFVNGNHLQFKPSVSPKACHNSTSSTRPSRSRRRREFGIVNTPARPPKDVELRQLVYCTGKRAKLMKVSSSSKITNFNPSYLKNNPHLLEAIVPWIRRDLLVLFEGDMHDAEIVKDYVLSLIIRVHVQSELALECLEEYLGRDAQLFIHELVCFAKSSLSLSDYDKYAQYT